MMQTILTFLQDNWRSGIEIAILTVAIYYGYLFFRGTRGAKVLTGFALIFLTLILTSQLLQLREITWLIQSLTAFLVIALVIIFQPELRRALAALGSHHIFASPALDRETAEVLAETIFELSNRQLGALIAIERDTNLQPFADSGVKIDCDLSPELITTIFFPKTPLHDGGLVIRNDRILAAASIFPVSQREDLDRNLGLRHRAAIGLTEDTDAVVIVVSEETGVVSICQRGKIERNFDPASLKRRLAEILLLAQTDEEPDSEQLAGQDPVAHAGDRGLVPHQKER
jgi:diadenylate cyclase